MQLEMVSGQFSICKLSPDVDWQEWLQGNFVSATRTGNELSIVAPQDCVPVSVQREDGFAMFRISGHLDFSLIGILAKISGVLADAGISIFVISTFDTDYVMVKVEQLDIAKQVLIENGYRF